MCPVTLTGDNYTSRARLMTDALKSNYKLVFVDRTQANRD